MKRLWFILGLSVSLVVSFFAFTAGPALADYGLEETASAAGIQSSKPITQIIGDVVGTGLSLVSVLFFGLMLYAGIKWMLARGAEEESKKALDTIIAASIGLVIVLGSYALTNFVFKSVGGSGGGGGGGDTKTPAPNTHCLKLNVANEWTCFAGAKACGNISMEYSSLKDCENVADTKNNANKIWCKEPGSGVCNQVDKNSCFTTQLFATEKECIGAPIIS